MIIYHFVKMRACGKIYYAQTPGTNAGSDEIVDFLSGVLEEAQERLQWAQEVASLWSLLSINSDKGVFNLMSLNFLQCIGVREFSMNLPKAG